jgi:hypothetical protein
MNSKPGYALISALCKNSNYISGNKNELNFLLAAQRTAEQNSSAQRKFCAALTYYYCGKLSPNLQLSKELVTAAQKKGFLLELQFIKYSVLLLHSQKDDKKEVTLKEISTIHEQLQNQVDLLTALEQIDFSQFMSFIKIFGYKNFMETFESILIEKFYLESGESYQKSSKEMRIPLTTLHSKRQKMRAIS